MESRLVRGVAPADCAALYDVLNPWNDGPFRAEAAFYDPLIHAAGSVLDAGCGTGAALRAARDAGRTGRLVGIDPDAKAPLSRESAEIITIARRG